jgi:hypothetical protein
VVDVRVDIVEKSVRIRGINVVGNERFSDKELLAGLELQPSNLLSFYRRDDKYSTSLEGDLELRSYYMDRDCGPNHFHAGGARAGEGMTYSSRSMCSRAPPGKWGRSSSRAVSSCPKKCCGSPFSCGRGSVFAGPHRAPKKRSAIA